MSFSPEKCPVCGKAITLKKDGTFRFHLDPSGKPPYPGATHPGGCPGTGRKP